MKYSDQEFAKLEKRVADGKKHLEGKWGFPSAYCEKTGGFESSCISLWHQLSNDLFEQMCMRGMFEHITPHEELMRSAEEKVQRVREQLIVRGYLKPTRKERRAKLSEQPKSTGYPLFATS